MSGGSFVFTAAALRSLQRDQDQLDQDRRGRQAAQRRLSAPRPPPPPPPPPRPPPRPGPPALCRDPVVHNALYSGDLEALQALFPAGASANILLEPQGGAMRWSPSGPGLCALAWEEGPTTALHVAAGRGFASCLGLLLRRGAEVDRAPGGHTALHQACSCSHTRSARLLLLHGADANALTDGGLAPLHVCTEQHSLGCARDLLQFGAAVGARSAEEEDTPLHVAARRGLPDHVDLYLRHGAAVDRANREGLTPLGAACAQPQETRDLQRYSQVCGRLLEGGADARAADRDRRTPLHLACRSVNPEVVELLLARGARVNAADYGGETPLHHVLKAAAFKLDHEPHRVVRALLNHGAIRVWPGALPKVLQLCSPAPRCLEVLLNAYTRLRVTEAWREALQPRVTEALQPRVTEEQRGFLRSVLLLPVPRSLQHLCRCSLRKFLQPRVHAVVPLLELPGALRDFLLLQPRGALP